MPLYGLVSLWLLQQLVRCQPSRRAGGGPDQAQPGAQGSGRGAPQGDSLLLSFLLAHRPLQQSSAFPWTNAKRGCQWLQSALDLCQGSCSQNSLDLLA